MAVCHARANARMAVGWHTHRKPQGASPRDRAPAGAAAIHQAPIPGLQLAAEPTAIETGLAGCKPSLFAPIPLVGSKRRLTGPAYPQYHNVVAGNGKYDSVAAASIRAKYFLLYMFQKQIIFRSLSGDVNLFGKSPCCLIEGTPLGPRALWASCPNPLVNGVGVAFGTAQDDDPANHPASPRRCRSRKSPMNSSRLRPCCCRASCNEARIAAASSAEGCDPRHSSTSSSRLVELCE
jgi:hypothetical protein